MDYKLLKEAVEKRIPQAYKTDFFKRYEYITSCPNIAINFNPYRNNGKMLPDEIIKKGKKDPYEYKVHAGERWFLESLLRIYSENLETDMPALFIYSFLKEYGEFFKEQNLLNDLLEKAQNDLKENHSPFPHNNTKYYLVQFKAYEYMQSIMKEPKKAYQETISSSEEMLATIITTVMGMLLEEYEYEYWRYPETEYERVQNLYKQHIKNISEIISAEYKADKQKERKEL